MTYTLLRILEFTLIGIFTLVYIATIIDPIKFCLGREDYGYDIVDILSDMGGALFSMGAIYFAYFAFESIIVSL